MTDYAAFLAGKAQHGDGSGFAPAWMPDFLFDFQAALTEWSLLKGRAAIFADCGLGKTPMQLVWAENVARHTGRRVLIVTPLAVGDQTAREAEKFGINAAPDRDARITITNYERLHHYSPGDFAGAVCDESSAIKSFDGVRRAQVTEFMRTIPYRLLCTATPAPNDYVELGTSSEALGALGHSDMLTRFFKNDQNTSVMQSGRGRFKTEFGQKWRFKPHAEQPFWRWVGSWARALRKPSDLGFDDARFVLPPLDERDTVVKARTLRPGDLFDLPASGFHEERETTRRTIKERCEAEAEKVEHREPAVLWCHLNAEGDLLEELIPGALQVSGADSDEAKTERLIAFSRGQARVLITKPSIAGWGLNWQHCAHVVYFPTHSYEQYYQAVRRCWRFGQTRPVVVDRVSTEGDARVLANLQRKALAADKMFADLVAHMHDALRLERDKVYPLTAEAPAWL